MIYSIYLQSKWDAPKWVCNNYIYVCVWGYKWIYIIWGAFHVDYIFYIIIIYNQHGMHPKYI